MHVFTLLCEVRARGACRGEGGHAEVEGSASRSGLKNPRDSWDLQRWQQRKPELCYLKETQSSVVQTADRGNTGIYGR